MRQSGQRNTDAFDAQLQTITNAQNAVSDQTGYTSQKAPKTVGAMLKDAFPEIASIGGARADSMPYHREGRALDVMIKNWNTPEGKALGDKVNAWALANAKTLGIVDTIWQDFWQPTDGGKGNFLGRMNQGPDAAHLTHVHLTFAPGASVDMSGLQLTPDEAAKVQSDMAKQAAKNALDELQKQYGPPVDPNNLPAQQQQMVTVDANGNYQISTPHGKKNFLGLEHLTRLLISRGPLLNPLNMLLITLCSSPCQMV